MGKTLTTLHEICKQIKEFKSYYILSIQKQNDISERNHDTRKKLCVSFSDDDEIQDLISDQTYKINTRNLLGVKNNNDWIFGLNIGNVMHLSPLKFDEVRNDLMEETTEKALLEELSTNKILDKFVLLCSAYFCIATEFRFLNAKVSAEQYPLKLSEMWHSKSVHT